MWDSNMKKIMSILVVGVFIINGFGAVSSNARKSKVTPNEACVIEEYDLIIISPDKFKSGIQPLINHKISHGVRTYLKITEDIYNEFTGADKPEQIKYFIKNAKENWNISYVLLIGDFRQIPIRYCHNNDNFQSMDSRFVSDLYYADIYDNTGTFCSWDNNNDGIYGGWEGDQAQDTNISLTPDVAVGRLACRNKVEVKIVANKIINYEKNTYGSDWFKNMVVAGGDTYSEAGGYVGDQYNEYEGEVATEKATKIIPNFNHIKLWASTGNLTTINLIKAINKGCGFLYLSGHGNPNVWLTHPPNSTEKVGNLPTPLMSFLVNQYKLPVCIVGGCHNSQLDVSLLKLLEDPWYFSTWVPECWSWKITSKPFGGAIATIGNTGLGWHGLEYGSQGGNNWLNIQFFREYANGTQIIGQIWKNAINQYLKEFPIDWSTPAGETSSLDAKTVQEWVLLGDPSLKIGGYSS